MRIEFTGRVRFYGLVDLEHMGTIELYATLDEAERELSDLLGDEPTWVSRVRIEEIELGDPSWN